jgi:hypothetical protein
LPLRLPRRGTKGEIEPADRPPRQVRRNTLVSVKYLLEKFGNPIEGLLRMASYDVDDLAVFLQCSRHDAWIEKRLLLALAAPYVVSKMPQGMVVAPMTGLTVTGFDFGAASRDIENVSGELLEDEVSLNAEREAVVGADEGTATGLNLSDFDFGGGAEGRVMLGPKLPETS